MTALNYSEALLARVIPPEIEAELPPDGDFATISPDFGRALVRLIRALRPKSILEFGAGASSLLVAMALQDNGVGRLTTVEHAPRYSASTWARVQQVRGVDAELIAAPLVLRLSARGLLYQYQMASRLKARAPYDFVIVDAPPGVCGRDTTLYQALPYLSKGATIILDDAARVQEGTVVNRWLRACPGLEVCYWNKDLARGVAVLQYSGDGSLNVSLRTLLGTCHDRWIYRQSVRALRRQDAGIA